MGHMTHLQDAMKEELIQDGHPPRHAGRSTRQRRGAASSTLLGTTRRLPAETVCVASAAAGRGTMRSSVGHQSADNTLHLRHLPYLLRRLPRPWLWATCTSDRRRRRDWESYVLVPWVMHLPHDTGARDIVALIIRELRRPEKRLCHASPIGVVSDPV
jgi:hypothetical protein